MFRHSVESIAGRRLTLISRADARSQPLAVDAASDLGGRRPHRDDGCCAAAVHLMRHYFSTDAEASNTRAYKQTDRAESTGPGGIPMGTRPDPAHRL